MVKTLFGAFLPITHLIKNSAISVYGLGQHTFSLNSLTVKNAHICTHFTDVQGVP